MAGQLTHLDEVERLSETVIRILGMNPSRFTLQGTNTYLVGTGKQRLLIDTGEGKPAWKAAIRRVLAQENASVYTVLITHWHHDHIRGVDDLLELCPGATVFKNMPAENQRGISHGQKFSVDGAAVVAIHAPGHTADHSVFVLGAEDAMFTGDNVLGQGTAVFEDLSTYVESLERMRSAFKGRIYPGHGPVVEDGPARIADYLNHRRQREAQVLETLGSPQPGTNEEGSWTVMDMVRAIYTDVPQALHQAAGGGVLQILHKLEKEGRVYRDTQLDKWRL